IDCDIHPDVPSVESLFPYLSDYWREQIRQTGFKGPVDTYYPASAAISARPEAGAAHGKGAETQLALIREQVRDPRQVSYGMLTCVYAVDSLHNPDGSAALARAVNDWQVVEWLDQEPRLRASLVVPSRDPQLAAREIDRIGGHAGFVQVLLPVCSEA